jgi:hypothetical protein
MPIAGPPEQQNSPTSLLAKGFRVATVMLEIPSPYTFFSPPISYGRLRRPSALQLPVGIVACAGYIFSSRLVFCAAFSFSALPLRRALLQVGRRPLPEAYHPPYPQAGRREHPQASTATSSILLPTVSQDLATAVHQIAQRAYRQTVRRGRSDLEPVESLLGYRQSLAHCFLVCGLSYSLLSLVKVNYPRSGVWQH